MFVLNPEASRITGADIQALIDNSVIESGDIEYKLIVEVGPSANVKSKVKFLGGVSSFANTGGGDFLIGVKAVGGVPQAINAIDRAQIDSLKLAIEQLMQSGISPRLPSASLIEIPITDAAFVLLVRVAPRWR